MMPRRLFLELCVNSVLLGLLIAGVRAAIGASGWLKHETGLAAAALSGLLTWLCVWAMALAAAGRALNGRLRRGQSSWDDSWHRDGIGALYSLSFTFGMLMGLHWSPVHPAEAGVQGAVVGIGVALAQLLLARVRKGWGDWRDGFILLAIWTAICLGLMRVRPYQGASALAAAVSWAFVLAAIRARG